MKHLKITIWALMAVSLLLGAQQAAAPAAGAGDAVQSVAESPMEAITRMFNDTDRQHQAFMSDYQDLQRRIKAVSGITDNQARLEEALRLKRMLAKVTDRIGLEQEKHIALKSRIDRHLAANRLLKQEIALIDTYVDSLQRFGIDQEKTAANIGLANKFLTRQVNAVPPPAEYRTGLLDIEMRLVVPQGGKTAPFYISTAPLTVKQWQELRRMNNSAPLTAPADNVSPDAPMSRVTFSDALTAAAEISRLYGGKYLLPSTAEAAAAVKADAENAPRIAIWLRGKWEGDHKEAEAAQRFGIGMNIIWDPAGVLFKHTPAPELHEAFFGELPQAKYRELGIMLTTSARTGKSNAIREAEAALDAEAKFTNGTTAQ